MTELDIKIEGEDDVKRILGKSPIAADSLLRNAMKDISDAMERVAKTLAPIGETGNLHRHPVDVKNVFGEAVTGAFLFGGGLAVRPAGGGQFIAGRAGVENAGQEVSHIEITVAKDPFYAKFVHDGTANGGTGYIRPVHGKYMKFVWKGKRFRAEKVHGQVPQPYLTKAYEVVDRSFVPERVERLRLQVSSLYR